MRWNSQVQRSIDFFANVPAKGFSQRTVANFNNCIFPVSSSTSPTSSSSSSSASSSSSSNASSVALSTASQLHHHLCVRQLHHLHHLYHVFAWENNRLRYEQILHLICDMTWVSHDAKWMYCKQRHMETPRLAANFSQQCLKAMSTLPRKLKF